MEATFYKDSDSVDFTASAAMVSGQVVQLPDGRAGIVAGLAGVASGDAVTATVDGQVKATKAAAIVILDGQAVYWNKATATAGYTGDFYLGVAVADAAAGDSQVAVDLNVPSRPLMHLGTAPFTDEATNGLGVTGLLGTAKLAFDAVNEVGQAALFSDAVVGIDDGPIFESWMASYDNGASTLDVNLGFAVASHATDFDLIAQYAAFHLDGGTLDLDAQSKDGTTTVAATDTLVNLVDNTYVFLQIDARNKADVKFYVNGVRVLSGTTFDMSAFAGNLKPIVHIEKTASTSTADIRVRDLVVRTKVVG